MVETAVAFGLEITPSVYYGIQKSTLSPFASLS